MEERIRKKTHVYLDTWYITRVALQYSVIGCSFQQMVPGQLDIYMGKIWSLFMPHITCKLIPNGFLIKIQGEYYKVSWKITQKDIFMTLGYQSYLKQDTCTHIYTKALNIKENW